MDAEHLNPDNIDSLRCGRIIQGYIHFPILPGYLVLVPVEFLEELAYPQTCLN